MVVIEIKHCNIFLSGINKLHGLFRGMLIVGFESNIANCELKNRKILTTPGQVRSELHHFLKSFLQWISHCILSNSFWPILPTFWWLNCEGIESMPQLVTKYY